VDLVDAKVVDRFLVKFDIFFNMLSVGVGLLVSILLGLDLNACPFSCFAILLGVAVFIL
jgi:hypothetical protein